MAITATITLNHSSITVNQVSIATVTVSNSGGSAVNVLAITPVCTVTATGQPATGSIGVADLGPGTTVAVPAAGSLTFAFGVAFPAPSNGLLGTTGGTYKVGCLVSSADGSNVAPTAATLTVSNPAFDPTEQ